MRKVAAIALLCSFAASTGIASAEHYHRRHHLRHRVSVHHKHKGRHHRRVKHHRSRKVGQQVSQPSQTALQVGVSQACVEWLGCAGEGIPARCRLGETGCYEPVTRTSFPWYGNNTLGDCSLAAAADWYIAALGIEPNESEVIHDFQTAGQPDGYAVPPGQMFDFAGITLYEGHQYTKGELELARSDLEGLLHRAGPLYTDLYDPEAQEGHAVMVDGYTLTGPLVVTWTQTYQMTWTQWETYVTTIIEIRRTMAI